MRIPARIPSDDHLSYSSSMGVSSRISSIARLSTAIQLVCFASPCRRGEMIYKLIEGKMLEFPNGSLNAADITPRRQSRTDE